MNDRRFDVFARGFALGVSRRALLRGATVATAGTLVAARAKAAPAVQACAGTTVSVFAAQPWTATGVSVTPGDLIEISASGRIRIAGSDPGKSPDGTTFDSETPSSDCIGLGAITEAAACWSLIGRIGGGTPFPVGYGTSFTAASSGALELGVNDNVFGDNSGSWTACVKASTPDLCAGVVCEDGPCVSRGCDPDTGLCINLLSFPAGTACSGPDICQLYVCVAGFCVGGDKCIDADPCADISCDPSTGICMSTPTNNNKPCGPGQRCKKGACTVTPDGVWDLVEAGSCAAIYTLLLKGGPYTAVYREAFMQCALEQLGLRPNFCATLSRPECIENICEIAPDQCFVS